MNETNSLKYLTLLVVVILVLYMLLAMYFAGRSLALLRHRTPQRARNEIRAYMLPLAIVGSVLITIIFMVGILMIVNKHRYTDPASHLLIAVLFGMTILIAAMSYATYINIKDVGQLPPREVRQKTKSAASTARWATFTSIAGISVGFLVLLLLNAESLHEKRLVPYRVTL